VSRQVLATAEIHAGFSPVCGWRERGCPGWQHYPSDNVVDTFAIGESSKARMCSVLALSALVWTYVLIQPEVVGGLRRYMGPKFAAQHREFWAWRTTGRSRKRRASGRPKPRKPGGEVETRMSTLDWILVIALLVLVCFGIVIFQEMRRTRALLVRNARQYCTSSLAYSR
jgi:hypothetical protein